MHEAFQLHIETLSCLCEIKIECFGKSRVKMDNVLSNVVPHVLSRHTEISFHAEGVPDPLYGPWYAGILQAGDEAGAAVAALRDSAVVHQELFREVDAFLDFRFNTVGARPNFVTYWCNHRLIAVSTTIHVGSVVNVAAMTFLDESVARSLKSRNGGLAPLDRCVKCSKAPV